MIRSERPSGAAESENGSGAHQKPRARNRQISPRDACAAAGFAARFPVVGTLLGIVCGDVPAPVDFDGAKRTDEAAYAAFFQAMLAEGVAMAPGAYEAIFVGLAHTDDVIDEIADAAGRAAPNAVEVVAAQTLP